MNGFKKVVLIAATFVFGAVNLKVNAEEKPWLTNEPYLDDQYSKLWLMKYEKQSVFVDEHSKRQCAKKAEQINLVCLDSASTRFKDDFIKKNPKRGSLAYVINRYSYIKEDIEKHRRELKTLLADLDALSLKTRSVRAFDMKVSGELTYEDVRNEICLIEKHIGFSSTKKYCDAY